MEHNPNPTTFSDFFGRFRRCTGKNGCDFGGYVFAENLLPIMLLFLFTQGDKEDNKSFIILVKTMSFNIVPTLSDNKSTYLLYMIGSTRGIWGIDPATWFKTYM